LSKTQFNTHISSIRIICAVCTIIGSFIIGAKTYEFALNRKTEYLSNIHKNDSSSINRTKISSSDSNLIFVDVDSLITIRNEDDIFLKRGELISHIWETSHLPTSLPSKIKKNITDGRFLNLQNLKRIDRIVTNMEYGINSVIYHFHPERSNNKIIIYHQGHSGGFINGKNIINYFLERDFSVLAFSMPLIGLNSAPTIQLSRFGKLKLINHDRMKFLERPMRFFFEPITTTLNYIENDYQYDSFYMVGLSGGGWTTILYAAIDSRIEKSYPVAGSLPMYLRSITKRDWSDYEQTLPDLYRIANYLELFVMGSYGQGRGQLQILNKYDSCCFSGIKYRTYEQSISKHIGNLGKGQFSVYLDDTHAEHKISNHAMDIIFHDMVIGEI